MTLSIKNETKGSELIDYLKEKVLGYNILKMKSLNDITMLLNILDNEIEYYDKNSIVPLDIRLSYCQDCEIKSTGNIIIGGKGEYTSKLTAMKDIMFTKPDAVARGGVISAGNNITAGIAVSYTHLDNDKRPVKESFDLTLSIKLPILERHINLIVSLFDKFILDTVALTHIFI